MHIFEIVLSNPDHLYFLVVGVIAASILLLFAVEIIAKLNDTPNDNVNTIIRDWAYGKFYFITFFFGIVAGHLFLGINSRWLDCSKLGLQMDCKIFDVLVIAGLTILLIITGLIFKESRVTRSKTFQLVLFTAGLLIGHFVWSMNDFVALP